MSSRNAYLSEQERVEARALSQFLATVRERFAAGERDGAALLAGHKEALAAGDIDYVTLADAETLESIDRVERRAVVALAVKFSKARLLDNTVLDPATA